MPWGSDAYHCSLYLFVIWPSGPFAYNSFPPLDRSDQWDEIKSSFERRHGIPNIFGAIDGTHIPVAMPRDDDWKGYINQKGWASITFQCVVDGDGNFRNVEPLYLTTHHYDKADACPHMVFH
jgi:hypothetical protein